MKYIIRWKVNQYRQDKRTGVLQPVHRSKYLQYLFNVEEKRFK
ncbi:hypothetical protein LC040_12215 [Bacillus tianshenii]|nr:hypothetical protein LC040_12215 [Bacillus tianshenii]